MFHLLHNKGDNYLTEIPGCPEKRINLTFNLTVNSFNFYDWFSVHIYIYIKSKLQQFSDGTESKNQMKKKQINGHNNEKLCSNILMNL